MTLLSLVLSGNKDLCLGEFITFTCTGHFVGYLQWNLTSRNGSYQSKLFRPNSDNVIGETESLNGFKANVTGADANNSSRGNITLELSAVVRLEMNETTIECLTLAINGAASKTTLIVGGKVDNPRIPVTIIIVYNYRLQCSTYKFEL